MNRRTPRIVGLLALLVVLLGGGALLVAQRLLEGRGQIIASRASDALGLEVAIGGGIQLSLLPQLQFEARDVTVANLPGRPAPHLAEIGLLEFEISYLGLLRGKLEIDALEIERITLWIENDPNAQIAAVTAAAPEPETEGQELRFSIGSVDLRQGLLHYQSGDREAPLSARLETLSLEARGIHDPFQFSARGEFEGRRFDLAGELGPLGNLYEAVPYPVELHGRFQDATFQLRGTAGQPTRLRDLDLAISGELPALPKIYDAFFEPDPRVPQTGPISFAGRIVRKDGPVAIEELSIETDTSDPLYGSLTGSVRDLVAFRKVELALRLHARDLGFLQPTTRVSLPAVESVYAELEISDRGTDLGVSGKLRVVLPEGLGWLEAEGSYADLLRQAGLDVAIRGEARDLGVIGNALSLDPPLPVLGPVTLRGRLRDPNGRIGVYELEARAGSPDGSWAELTGSLRDLERVAGARLRAEFVAEDLSLFAPVLGRPLPGGIGPITGYTVLSDEDGSLGLDPVHLHGGQQGLLSIDLEGSFDDLSEIDEIEAELKLRARDLAVVAELLDAEFDPVGPVVFSGRISGSEERLQASGELQLDRTRIDGRGTASFNRGRRPNLRATLSSSQLWLDDLGIEPEAADPNTVPEKESDDLAGLAAGDTGPYWWQGTRDLPFDQLRNLDLDLTLRADRISGRNALEIHDASTTLRLEDGRLEIRDLAATWAGGDAHAALIVDASAPETELLLEFDLQGLDLEQILSQTSETTDASGLIDARGRLESRGQTRDQIRSQLSGEGAAVMRDGSAAGEVSRLFVRNFVGLTFPSIQFGERAPLVSCALASIEIESGIALVRELQIQGGDVEVTGSGTIDLARERYHLELVPRSRRRGIVSVVPVVRVRGPLEQPRATPLHRTIATSLFEGVVSNAVRPARSLLSRLRGSSDSEFRCEISPPETQP